MKSSVSNWVYRPEDFFALGSHGYDIKRGNLSLSKGNASDFDVAYMCNVMPSARELEILEPIALGKSKKEVANDFNISIYTVETTIKNVYEKLGINKIQDLVLWYVGVKLKISDQIEALKHEVISEESKKQAFTVMLILILSVNSLFDTQYRVRRYRRDHEIEYASPINYPFTA